MLGEIPFHAVSQLLRGAFGVEEIADEAARAEDTEPELPRRMPRTCCSSMICSVPGTPGASRTLRGRAQAAAHGSFNGAIWPGATQAVYVIEDVHWIDEVSESTTGRLSFGRSRTHALALLTYRPDYRRRSLDARCADDCPCRAERFGNRCPDHRAAGPGPIAGRVDDPDQPERARATHSCPGDRP